MKKIAIIGIPNTGKTTLYNKLSQKKEKTGNYSGVTISINKSIINHNNQEVEISDLPGLYSLYVNSQDEAISLKHILGGNYDSLILVSSVENIRNSMKILFQLKELNVPVALLINKRKKDIYKIDTNLLEKELGVQIIYNDVRSLEIEDILNLEIKKPKINENYLKWLEKSQKKEFLINNTGENFNKKKVQESINFSKKIDGILSKKNVLKLISKSNIQNKLDNIFIHKIWGVIIFIFIIFFSFDLIFKLSNFLTDYIDLIFFKIIKFTKEISISFNINDTLIDLISNGVLPALGGVVMFIPQIFLLFFFIRFLEESGYMVRVIYLLDKFMKYLGLSSKSIIPYISGTTCSIPAILSCRTIDNKLQRFITILTIPFTPCSAKIPIYTIMISMVIPNKLLLGFFNLQSIVLIGLYLLGYVMALISAIIIKKVLVKSGNTESKFLVEFPNYQLVPIKEIVYYSLDKSKKFFLEIGKVITILSVVLWVLSSYNISRNGIERSNLENSLMGEVGKTIEPAIEPLGYDWKIGISLLSSIVAREVFIGALASIYEVDEENEETLLKRMKSEINPKTSKPVFNLASGLSILIFYAFALQCISTLVVTKKELGSWKYSILQFFMMNTFAYSSAMLVYNLFS